MVISRHHSVPLSAGVVFDSAVAVAPAADEIAGVVFVEVLFLLRFAHSACVAEPASKKEFFPCAEQLFEFVDESEELPGCGLICLNITIFESPGRVLLKNGCVVGEHLAGEVYDVVAEAVA